MRVRLLSLLALCAFTVAHAQQVDQTGDVPVSLVANIVWGPNNVPSSGSGATATLSCYALSASQGASACVANVPARGTALPSMSTSPRLPTRFVPGVTYDVIVAVDNNFDPSTTTPYTGAPGAQLFASAPPGYSVEMKLSAAGTYFSARERQNLTFNNNARTSSITMKVRLRAALGDPGLRAGMATSLSADRVFWQLSLGTLANGTSAGSISFDNLVGSSDLAGMFTRAKMHCDSGSSEVLQLVDNADSTVVRQVVAPQVCVDIVGQLTSGTIQLKCYHTSQRSATVDANGYFTFTGDPYAWYSIQPQGTDAAGVIVSCDMRDLATATATGQAVVRTLSTTISRAATTDAGTGATTTTWTVKPWYDSALSALAVETRARTGNSETVTVKDGAGTVALSTTRTYQSMLLGEEITSSQSGTSSQVTTSYSYYSDSQSASWGKVLVASTTGGGWQGFTYDGNGHVSGTYGPFGQTPATTPTVMPETSGVATSVTYSQDAFNAYTRPATSSGTTGGTSSGSSSTSYTTESPFTAYSSTHPLLTVVDGTQTVSSDSTHSLQTITKFFAEDLGVLDSDRPTAVVTDDFLRGQPYSVQQPTGLKKSFAYQRGTHSGTTFTKGDLNGLEPFNGVDANNVRIPGNASRIAVITGSTNSTAGTACSSYDGMLVDTVYLIPDKSTLETTIRDQYARVVRTELYVWSSGIWNQVSWTNYGYNLANELTSRSSSNGGTYSAVYSGERLSSETSESGITVSYTYDAAGRTYTATQAAAGGVNGIGSLQTQFGYDALGHVTSKVVGDPLVEAVTSSATFDDAGRPKSETQPGPSGSITTSYSYDPTNRTRTTTVPNTGTRIETYNYDGSVASVTGTGVVAQYFSYSAPDTNGLLQTQITFGVKGGDRVRSAWADWLGRTVKSSRKVLDGSDDTKPAVERDFVEQATYDTTTGLLTSKSSTGTADVWFEYNKLGELTRSGLRIDGTGTTLTLASNDRITDGDRSFEFYNNDWWLTQTTTAYPTANSATALVTSTVRSRLTGFAASTLSETLTTDLHHNVSDKVVTVDPANATVTVTTTVKDNAGVRIYDNSQTETSINGLPTSVTGFDGLTYSTGYDALYRRKTVTAPRIGATTTVYYTGTQFPKTVTDAATNLVASYEYDTAGRTTSVKNAMGKYARTGYNTRDQVTQQWGDTTYPAEYVYDSYGQRKELHTYQTGTWTGTTWPGGTVTSTTTWTYDDPSGLLLSKKDASGQPVTFAYNANGQLYKRRWARGVSTTYGYDANTGELRTRTYSDNTTPNVTLTYTRAGQADTVTEKVGTTTTGYRSFVYNTANPLQLDAVDLDSFYGNRVLTRQYDSVGRPSGFKLGTASTLSADLTQTYYINGLGRFDHLTTAVGAVANAGNTFNYGYNPGGLLWTLGATGSTFSVTRLYEDHRNLLTSIESKYGAVLHTRYDYTYTTLSQRQTSLQTGDAYGDFGKGTFYSNLYNDRGELTDATDYLGDTPSDLTTAQQMSDRHFSYEFDSAGNRKYASRNGSKTDTVDPRDAFQANNLNQYTTRTNTYLRTAGTVSADTTSVTATGGGMNWFVGRQGRYWAADTQPTGTGPTAALLTLTAIKAGKGTGGTDLVMTDSSRTAYLFGTQSFTYDEDGNLKTDGIWTYTYDAENRLISMTSTGITGFPTKYVDFKYDYLGRRIQKHSNNTTSGTETWRRYLYDGDNLVAELDAPNGTSCGSIVRSYTWGLDIAGSPTATGGVGALLQITDHTTSSAYFPTYDGNGNIASLVRTDGVRVATYEYSPFGELLRCQGTYAQSNPFRFSTKFTDDEIGLVYYGARFYSPSLGRFINRDPIAEAGGLNLYGFCGNDGTNHWDYLGYKKKWWKKFLNPFGGDNPLNPLSNRNLRLAAMMPHYTNPLYWSAPNFYRETAPAVEGMVVGAVVSYFAGPEIGGAAGGFISGFDGALLNGGSLSGATKAGAIAAAIGFAMGGLSDAATSPGEAATTSTASLSGNGPNDSVIGFAPTEGTAAAPPVDFKASINVGAKFDSSVATNALVFEGERLPALVVYSSRELGYAGGSTIIKSLAASSVITAFDVDEIPKYANVHRYVNDKLGDRKFKNIVLERHGGIIGDGSERMIAYYDPSSPLMQSIAPHLERGGGLWLNWCFGGSFVAANPGYLPAMSQLFDGATVYYGTGLQQIFNGGLTSRVAAGADSYIDGPGSYLNYQQYPKK